MKIKKYLRPIYIIPAILITLGIFIFITINQNKNTIRVDKVEAITTDVVKTISASGSIKSDLDVNLSFGGTERITEINVKEGDYVEEGTKLASINASTIYQNAQAALKTKQIAINDRDLFIETYKNNLEGIGGREKYELQLNQKIEAVNRADADYNAILTSFSKHTIYAPISGTVLDVTKSVGETATAGETIIKIANTNDYYFEADIDQEDIGFLKQGQEVIVNLDAYDNYDFKGSVIEIPKFIDTGTKDNLTLKIRIISDNKNILLGMTGDALITVEKVENKKAVLFDEIFNEDSQYYVWTDENGLLKKQNINIGLEGDLYTQIEDSAANMKIVVPNDPNVEPEEGLKIVYTN